MTTTLVTGATGFIGRALCMHLHELGHNVIAVSRDAHAARAILSSHATCMSWDDLADKASSPLRQDDYAVVNLAGENVGRGGWTDEKRERILRSRVKAAMRLINAIERFGTQPRAFLQASAIGYYGDGGDRLLTEDAPRGDEFLSEVAAQEESATAPLAKHAVRTACIRTAVVLGRDGGALTNMERPFRLFVGGVPGSGEQYVSWIHLRDEVRAIAHILERDTMSGPVNLSSPNPVDARTFFTELGHALKRPAAVPMPAALVRLAMGQKGQELLLSSKRAYPARLIADGFEFLYPELTDALRELYGRRCS